MNRFTNIFTILICLLAMTACQKEIPFTGEVAKRKLVLNGPFSPDSTWNLHLSHSLSIADTGHPRSVTTGVLRIKDAAGQLLFTLDHDSAGFYSHATEKPQVGKTYIVEAEATGYEMITGTDKAPAPIVVSLVDSMHTTFLSGKVLSIDLLLSDPADKDNYYVLEAEAAVYDSNGVIVDFISPLYSYSLDPNLDVEGLGDETSSYQRIYIKDEKFQGQNYPVNVMVSVSYLEYLLSEPYSEGASAEIFFHIRTVSKGLYQYLKSYDKYQNYSFDPTFSQPVQVYSNMKKGFGIFGGYSESVMTFSY